MVFIHLISFLVKRRNVPFWIKAAAFIVVWEVP